MPPRIDAIALLDKLLASIEAKIARLEASRAALRTLRDNAPLLDSEFDDIVKEQIDKSYYIGGDEFFRDSKENKELDPGSSKGGHAGPPEGSGLSGTNYQRVVKFFVENENKPATNQMIRNAVGLNRGSVAVVLYTSHPDEFERVEGVFRNKVAWRLKPHIYERVRAGGVLFEPTVSGAGPHKDLVSVQPLKQAGFGSLRKAIREAVESFPDLFTSVDVVHYIEHHHPELASGLKRTSVYADLHWMRVKGEIELVQEGKGRTPGIYKLKKL